MPRPKPNKLHDELDALLDGRPVELTDELAPLAEAADALRVELAAYQLDPAVADRHLERVFDGSASVVQLPLRAEPNGWDLRRRLAAVALAAALVLAPATMASAAALPGQAMYPFKLAIEQLRIASVQWSSGREAVERTRVADARRVEVQRLADLQMFSQLPTAINALTKAVLEAEAAVKDAKEDGEPVASKVEQRLTAVAAAGGQAVQQAYAAAARSSVPLTGDTFKAIVAAVGGSRTVLPAPDQQVVPSGATPTPATAATRPDSEPADPTTGSTQPAGGTSVQPSTTVATTTTEATTTTTPPTTGEDATPGSAGGDQTGADGRSPDELPPPTTVPGP